MRWVGGALNSNVDQAITKMRQRRELSVLWSISVNCFNKFLWVRSLMLTERLLDSVIGRWLSVGYYLHRSGIFINRQKKVLLEGFSDSLLGFGSFTKTNCCIKQVT